MGEITPADSRIYRGRIAPSPTGYLHLGHAHTFWIAQERARSAGGKLALRIEDLDRDRCRPAFQEGILQDLAWFGFRWDEGPDIGGPCEPYAQSERQEIYVEAWRKLLDGGWIYPCHCSRKDVLQALSAPHGEKHGVSPVFPRDEEPIYPGTCRELNGREFESPAGMTWRFRVPAGETIAFTDGNFGEQIANSGSDFGDFVIWRRDDVPAYQLAVVVDDIAMEITEVVRGADLLTSTFRQILVYRALGYQPPAFFHCDLVTDENGVRLAKRNDALSLRTLRQEGIAPHKLREAWKNL